MFDDIPKWIETLLAVVGSMASMFLYIRRSIDHMITKRVKEQVSAAMSEVTLATSKQLTDFRQEMKNDLDNYTSRADAGHSAITSRLDALMLALNGKH